MSNRTEEKKADSNFKQEKNYLGFMKRNNFLKYSIKRMLAFN